MKIAILSAHKGSISWTRMISKISFNHGLEVDYIYSYNDKVYRNSNSVFSKSILRLKTYLLYPLKILRNRKFINNYDKLVVITSPFFLPYLVARFIKKPQLVVLYNDIYPQALLDKNILTINSKFYKYLKLLQTETYYKTKVSVFISQDHLSLVRDKYNFLNNFPHKIIYVPAHKDAANCINSDNNNINFLYSGSIGLFHDFKLFFIFLKKIQNLNKCKFRFNTNGFLKNEFETEIKKVHNELINKKIIELGNILNELEYEELMLKTDIGIIFQDLNGGSVVFPSKFASMLVSGQAILAFMKIDCTMAKIILDNDLGWVIDNSTDNVHFNVINEIFNAEILNRKRRNALNYGSINFSLSSISEQWYKLLADDE